MISNEFRLTMPSGMMRVPSLFMAKKRIAQSPGPSAPQTSRTSTPVSTQSRKKSGPTSQKIYSMNQKPEKSTIYQTNNGLVSSDRLSRQSGFSLISPLLTFSR